jgi:hypothetical protein
MGALLLRDLDGLNEYSSVEVSSGHVVDPELTMNKPCRTDRARCSTPSIPSNADIGRIFRN